MQHLGAHVILQNDGVCRGLCTCKRVVCAAGEAGCRRQTVPQHRPRGCQTAARGTPASDRGAFDHPDSRTLADCAVCLLHEDVPGVLQASYDFVRRLRGPTRVRRNGTALMVAGFQEPLQTKSALIGRTCRRGNAGTTQPIGFKRSGSFWRAGNTGGQHSGLREFRSTRVARLSVVGCP